MFEIGPIVRHSRLTAYRTAMFIWASVLLMASLQPKRPPHFHFSIAHRVAHFLGFGSLAFLARMGFADPGRTLFLPAAMSFVFGFAIELVQHWQNTMPIEWWDVRDDAIGILGAAILCEILCRRIGYEGSSELVGPSRATPN
jgi:hypothetical protein